MNTHACPHKNTYSLVKWYNFNHLHFHKEALTSKDIDRWRLADSAPSHVCQRDEFSPLTSSVNSSFYAFLLNKWVCVCACVHENPLTPPFILMCRYFQHTHSEFTQARCYFSTHFPEDERGTFSSSSSHLTLSNPLFCLSPTQSHPSIWKSLTQYYGDIMGPLTALLK